MDVRGKHFIPSRIFRSIDVCRCLIHSVANTNTTVRIHTSETIVLDQFGLHKHTNTYTIVISMVTRNSPTWYDKGLWVTTTLFTIYFFSDMIIWSSMVTIQISLLPKPVKPVTVQSNVLAILTETHTPVRRSTWVCPHCWEGLVEPVAVGHRPEGHRSSGQDEAPCIEHKRE